MNPRIVLMLTFSILLPGLSGCAGLVIGGAATGASVVHDRRTAGTVVEDQSIELKAKTGLFKDEELRQQTHLNVTSYNNIVLLSGEAPNAVLKQRAGKIVASVEKVRHVHNEVQIAAPSSMMSRSSDSVITAKVKTSMLGIKGLEDFDPTRVKVVTENSVVFLMGLVTRKEAGAVTEAARQVSGVQRVVKLFEYLD